MNGPRIALWGFYAYGSFGDDLAAVLIGSHLQERFGARIVVYGLASGHADRFGFELAPTVADLVPGADLVVCGGGSSLESAPPPSGRFGMAARLPDHARHAAEVVATARRLGVPLVGISLGGNGASFAELQPRSKRELLETARFVSVRHAEDLPLLEESGTPGDAFPDLLWQTAAAFPASSRGEADRRPRLGINVFLGNLLSERALAAVPLLLRAALRRRDLDVVFFDVTHRERSPFRALTVPGARGRLDSRKFGRRDLADDLRFLASLDLLISTQMHPGLVAMSYGVPWIALAADRRARRLLAEHDLERFCFGRDRLAELRDALADPAATRRLMDELSARDLDAPRRRSAGHLRALDEIVAALPERR